jgi:hypothetical protein
MLDNLSSGEKEVIEELLEELNIHKNSTFKVLREKISGWIKRNYFSPIDARTCNTQYKWLKECIKRKVSGAFTISAAEIPEDISRFKSIRSESVFNENRNTRTTNFNPVIPYGPLGKQV